MEAARMGRWRGERRGDGRRGRGRENSVENSAEMEGEDEDGEACVSVTGWRFFRGRLGSALVKRQVRPTEPVDMRLVRSVCGLV